MDESLGRLPTKPMDSFTENFQRFLRIEATAGIVLLFCTVIALTLSNSPWSVSYLAFWETPVGIRWDNVEFARSLKHWINDGLMTFFFFLVALELNREMVLGELRNWQMAALSFAGALGGMILPAGVFLMLLRGGEGWHGWGTVMSTDTAFVIGCLAVLGSRIPQSLRLFLLSLAIFDDIGAILVIAFGYGASLNWVALSAAFLGITIMVLIAVLGIRSIPIYFALGAVVWLAFDASGIHPTIAGVILGLLTPARSWVSDDRLHAVAITGAATRKIERTCVAQMWRREKPFHRSSGWKSQCIRGWPLSSSPRLPWRMRAYLFPPCSLTSLLHSPCSQVLSSASRWALCCSVT
jgi:NhaA family Na+:H+ antiporter